MRASTRILAALGAFLLALACPGAHFTRWLTIKGDDAYPPYSSRDADGEPVGFGVDLFRAVSTTMGLQGEIELGPWHRVRRRIEAGEVDVVIGMFRSAEREQYVDFTLPHVVVSHAVFVRRGTPIRTLEDLAGRTILLQRGDIMDDFADQHRIGQRFLHFDSQVEVLRALAEGQGDAALLPRLQGLHLCRTNRLRNLRAVGPPLAPLEFCFAVRKGDAELVALLNEGLMIVKADGTYDRLYQQWFGVHAISFWQRREVRYVVYALLFIVVLLAVLVVRDRRMNRRLRRSQAEIAALETRWNLALEASALGVFDWEVQRDSIVYSDQYCRLLGEEPGSLGGSIAGLRKRVHPDDLAVPQERLDAHLRGETEYYQGEYRMRVADGAYRWFHARGQVIERDADGRPLRHLGILSDVTERKLMEIELQQAKDLLEQRVRERTAELAKQVGEAEQINRAMINVLEDLQSSNRKLERVSAALADSNRELEVFAHSVSHDLRAPLRAIDGFAGIIEEDYGSRLDEEGHRLLHVVRDNARRMGDLIDDLLTFSRLGRQQLVASEVPVAEVVGELVAEQRRTVGDKVEFVLDDLPAVHGDRGMLRQVFANLLDNAVKYSLPKPNPRIGVGGERDHRGLHYWVTDNGIGFEQKYAEKIFAVFERLHLSEQFAGTGVGLSLVQRIVQRHGGTAWAQGEPGQGATFHIRLPTRTGSPKG